MDIKLSKITYIITPYAFAVSILYLLSFWSPFKINIFEYITLSDIVISSFSPILYGVLFFTIGAVSVEILSGPVPEGGGADTRTGRFLNKHFHYIGVFMFLGAIFLMLFTEINNKYLVGGLMLIGPIYYTAIKHGMITDIIPNKRLRSIVFLIFIYMPFLALDIGQNNSTKILEGNVDYYVDVKSFDNQSTLNGQHGLKYVGKMGDYVFMLSNDNNKMYISKFPEEFVLKLERQNIKNNIETEMQIFDKALTNDGDGDFNNIK